MNNYIKMCSESPVRERLAEIWEKRGVRIGDRYTGPRTDGISFVDADLLTLLSIVPGGSSRLGRDGNIWLPRIEDLVEMVVWEGEHPIQLLVRFFEHGGERERKRIVEMLRQDFRHHLFLGEAFLLDEFIKNHILTEGDCPESCLICNKQLKNDDLKHRIEKVIK